MLKKGRFIVIEGTDGSGKTTQFKKLVLKLREAGFKIATFDFPQYDKPSSYFVREYLNGNYGSWKEVGPYKASIFYALDRFSAGRQISDWINEGKVVLSNRYVASNMGHQGAKIKNKKERKDFFKWLYKLEYGIMSIPKPDLNIVLHMPADVAQKLVDKKGTREYIGGVKRDLHEADIRHLRQAEETYLYMVDTFPRDFKVVECVQREKLLSPDDVHKEIWKIIEKKMKKKAKK